LPKSAILEVSFCPRSGETAATPYLVRVRHASKQPQGDWLIGCAFVKNRSALEMSKFLSWSNRYESKAPSRQARQTDGAAVDPFRDGSARERRKAARRAGSAVTVQVIQPLSQIPIDGWVVDRSCIGICISLPQLIHKGFKVKIRPVKSGNAGAWNRAVAKNCRLTGSRWLLGCQWITDMPAYSLQLFG